MSYGLWQLFTEIFYVVVAIGAVAVLVGSVVSVLFTFMPKSRCTGDCEQGRRCTCEEKDND